MNKIIFRLTNHNHYVQRNYLHCSKKNFKSFTKWYRSLWIPQAIEPPYSHVIQIGDPVLRQKAEVVPKEYINSKELNYIIDKMIEVLHKYDCVGLAAPQIGVPLRIIIMEFNEKLKKVFSPVTYETRQMETLPLTILVNPMMKVRSYDKKTFVESCASIKGYSAEVERYDQVLLSGMSRSGEEINLDLKGWNSRIGQHEMDHLDGRVYTDIMNRTSLICTCWQAVNSKGGRVEIPFHK